MQSRDRTTPRFEDLLDRHHDELFRYLWRLLGKKRRSDPTLDPEDLVQEVVIRAYEAFPRLHESSNYRAWLYKIATHCAFARLRQTKRRSENLRALALANATNDNEQAPITAHGQLRTAIERLPGKQRACLMMRYLQELDYREIAKVAGCSASGARANVYQALRYLRRALKEEI
jgi:RNA polymerase sigma-70 factor (ECF subfamily)